MRVLVAAIMFLLTSVQPAIAETPDQLRIANLRLTIQTIAVPAASVTSGAGRPGRAADVPHHRVDQSTDSRRTVSKPSWISRHPALFGALLGAGAGAVTGYALGQDCSSNTDDGSCSSKGGASAVGAGLGAAGGALVGLLVGRK